ncbi:hypothetical protein Prudu_283S000300 [Prunus dulcis]|uniref:Uncharacterized protein n=1 Tax=Prunus dulcis TaxID=3755 RepID=A0A4Y1QYW1_PRUDU|nr:hypothetical protein Prudu_006043 [Prunus dulcis]BBN68111.1 hypothetical protein Prudu_283S000300 [Prunus dulcis]
MKSKPPSLSSILSQTRAQKLGCFEQWLFMVISDQFRPPQLRFSRDRKLRSRALEMELIVEPRHPGPDRPVGGTFRGNRRAPERHHRADSTIRSTLPLI